MKIYIASSWKNHHAVEMLTGMLEEKGHEVVSFVRAAVDTEGRAGLQWDVEKWIASEDGLRKFQYDISGATESDLLIYIGPSGTDAWAEVGAAYGAGVTIFGLWSKGEQAGLMRRMVQAWFTDHRELLLAVGEDKKVLAPFRLGDDLVIDFIRDCCVQDIEARTKLSVLYDRFEGWYQRNVGPRFPGRAWLVRQLLRFGEIKKIRVNGEAGYSGISIDTTKTVRACRVCGCTDDHACPGGSSWVEDPEGGNLCSRCAEGQQ